jgi:protein-S-isoprenylcysteine O-methyltransferase Ste14
VVLFCIRKPVVGARSGFLGAAVALGGTFSLVLLSRADAAAAPGFLFAAASVLIVVGVVFSSLSLFALGRCFGIFPEARGLVTSGPYRWIRHPVYLGEMVSALGVVLPILNPTNAVVYGCFCLLQYWRARNEEQALERAFPAYREYRARTWRLVPWLH